MSKVVECRMLMPVGVVIDMGEGETLTVPTFYDPQGGEVFVVNRRDHDIREDVVAAVKDFVQNRKHTLGPATDAVDAQTWDQIRILTGLAKPPAQEQ